jgi:NAD(P)-dependent dehydrogenase (short-subunit alcohol dehydrogenase family)
LKTKKIKSALIIGAASGMGNAIALQLLSEKINVHVADLKIDAFKNLSENKLEKSYIYKVDVTKSESVTNMFDTLKKNIKSLDLMIYTAGILGESQLMENINDDEWARVIAVNLTGMFYCCRETVKLMKKNRSGRIILFSSVASLTPTPGAIHYSVSKGGVNMFGKTLAKEVAKYNIRVNIIAPGYIKTPMLEKLPNGFSERIIKKTPLKRMGDVKEIASLISYLITPSADFFTGQIFSPNGGLVI